MQTLAIGLSCTGLGMAEYDNSIETNKRCNLNNEKFLQAKHVLLHFFYKFSKCQSHHGRTKLLEMKTDCLSYYKYQKTGDL